MKAHELLEEKGESGARDLRVLAALIPYLAGQWGRMGLALLLLPLATACQVSGTLMIRHAIDDAVVSSHLGLLWKYLCAYLCLVAAESTARFGHTYLLQACGQEAMHALRARIVRSLHASPQAFFDANPVGRLLTRVTSDVESLNELFASGAVAIVGDLVTIVGVVGTMLVLDVWMGLTVVVALPILVALLVHFRRGLRKAFEYTRARMARMTAYLAESLAGMEVIKICRRERTNAAAFGEISREYRDGYHTSNFLEAALYAGVDLVGQLTVAALVWGGGGRILAGHCSFGTLVAFVRYVEDLFAPLRDMSAKFAVFQSAITSTIKIQAVLAVPGEEDPNAASEARVERGAIAFDGVRFAYRPGEDVLQDITFDVSPGQRIAFVGATGAGKTTVVKLLSRLYAPQTGRIALDDRAIDDYALSEVRRAIAYLPQDPVLFTGTILENVTLGRADIPPGAAERAMRALGGGEILDRLPAGMDTMLLERGADLSLGERQIVALARVLVLDPRIVVLDEATASVDPITERLLERALGATLEGRTALVIAHRLSTARRADQILVFARGRIVERGTHDALVGQNGLYARLAALHFGRPQLETRAAGAS